MDAASDGFPGLERAARELGEGVELTPAQLRELLCSDCDFYDEEHEDDLECSCFRMLGLLLARGVITPFGLAEALGGRSDDANE